MAFYREALAWVAAIAALSFGSIAPAAAAVVQSTAGDDPVPENLALQTVGAVIGRFRIDASVDTLYDSNIQRLGDGTAVLPGREKADFRFSPLVTVSTNLPAGRQSLFASAALGRDIYARNTQLNRNRYVFNGGLNWQLGTRCSGVVDIDYSSRQQLFSDVALNESNTRKTLSYGGNANCQAPVGLGFGGSVRRIETRNDAPSRRDFDVDSTVISPHISYALPTLGRFSVTGSFNKATYPNRDVADASGNIIGDGVQIWSGRFGYARGLGSRLSISAGLSYIKVAPKPGSILVQPLPAVPGDPLPTPFVFEREKNSNLGFDLGISYNSGARLAASLAVSRAATASANVGAQYQLNQSYALDLDYRLTRSISLSGGGSFIKRDYRNSFVTAGAGEPLRRLQDKISRVYSGVNYNPVPLYSVGFELSYQDRNSNPALYSYGSVAGLLKLRIGFGR